MSTVDKISTITGISIGEIHILFCLIGQMVASALYYLLPIDSKSNNYNRQKKLREFYGLSIGLLSCLYLFPLHELLIIFASNVIFYNLSKLCKTPQTTLSLSFVIFSILCMANIHRAVFFYEENLSNFSLLLMILVPKQIYFNWHIYGIHARKNDEDARFMYPSLFDYFCYIFNYIGNLTTPIYSYQEYLDFIDQNYEETKFSPRNFFRKAGYLILTVILYIIIGKYHDYNLIDTKSFEELNMAHQLLYITVQGFYIRVRYYFIWLLADVDIVLANFRDSDTNYKTYISSIDLMKVETSTSPKTKIANWNISITKFYRICFYNPLIDHLKMKKSRASLFVFVLSAFWHGFYPTYYLSFFFTYIMSMTERIVFRNKEELWFFPTVLFWFFFDIMAIIFKRHTFRSTKEVLLNTWLFVLLNPLMHVSIRIYLRYLHKRRKHK